MSEPISLHSQVVFKPSEFENFILGDSREILPTFSRGSFHLCITSPPYNIGNDKNVYVSDEDNLDPIAYESLLLDVFHEVYRVLVTGGRCVVVLNQMYFFPRFISIMLSLGFVHRFTIIWDKSNLSRMTAWGSWMSPSNPNVVPPYEYIVGFHKEVAYLPGEKGDIDITREEFISCSNGLWRLSASNRRFQSLKATYPVEIPLRLMKFLSYRGNSVVDPFAGSGTTVKACERTGRYGVGIEKNEIIYREAVEYWEG